MIIPMKSIGLMNNILIKNYIIRLLYAKKLRFVDFFQIS